MGAVDIDGIRTWTGRDWSVSVSDVAAVATPTGVRRVPADRAGGLQLRRRWFRWNLYHGTERLAILRGLSAADAAAIKLAVARLSVSVYLERAVAWTARRDVALAAGVSAQRWVTTEAAAELVADRPDGGLGLRVTAAGCASTLTEVERDAVAAVEGDLEELVAETNRRIVATELVEQQEFFERIERSPLTTEQATAVVCCDNRVQVLAAAGSGKTSVMVARAAYAVHRGLVAPERILLLAFNKAAALELGQRVTERFEAAGLDATGVRAATFHSFGLEAIGGATGRKPRLAAWLDRDNGVGEVLRIVDALSDASPAFRYDWDLYRLLYSSAPTELGEGDPDGWDPETATAGFRTFAGEVVRSHGERLIADFLYLSGVSYRYEQPYAFDVADAAHSQYRPDFYYPDIDVWHEHLALDRNGNPPADFDGYADSMAWKRELHQHQGTTLIETTFDDVVNGDGLGRLRAELEAHGVVFDWNPDRPTAKWAYPLDHAAMARLVRTFMAHAKSNSLDDAAIDARLRADPLRDGYRTRLFVRIWAQIHDEWQRRLAADGAVDFEDMLITAAHHVEAGWDPGFELVMVDEFQDASAARARLTRALVAPPGRYLLAVGDDWQAINRFAGSDLSVMTGFADWFGPGQQLALTTTFRCPQTICDVASTFVSRNPSQFTKPMRSAHTDQGAPVHVVFDENPQRAVAAHLERLSQEVAGAAGLAGRRGLVTVEVLGRYRSQNEVVGRTPANLDVRFRTAHSSKGLEADHIVIVGLDTTRYGFPSLIADDPVLEVAMPVGEDFPHAEERRLFYVALTRARRTVTVVAPPRTMSPFVTELLEDPNVVVVALDGTPTEAPKVCPTCREGTLTVRTGRYGRFWGCTRFPACRHTRNVDP